MDTVQKGQITYDAEGKDIETSIYFSRVIHWPGGKSGVTIGRGYDMWSRSKAKVKNDMIAASIPVTKAIALAEGAGLKADKAKVFVTKNKKSITKITNSQQVKLFDLTYPVYEARGKSYYNKYTSSEPNRIEWDQLHLVIRDMLVDFVYQGFTKAPNAMKAGMNNDCDELIKYIQSSTSMMRYEKGRGRVKYLQSNKPRPIAKSVNALKAAGPVLGNPAKIKAELLKKTP